MTKHGRLIQIGLALVAAALVARACATQARPGTRQSPQFVPSETAKAAVTPAVPVASAAPAASQQLLEATGKFALQPASGPWDAKVSATASGLRPQAKYDLVWVTGKVQWKLSEDRSKYL